MPQLSLRVDPTPEEHAMRGRWGYAVRERKPAAEIRRLELGYYLHVARRKAAEYAAEAERLESELERVS